MNSVFYKCTHAQHWFVPLRMPHENHREVTLDFLGELRGSFSDYQSILNYLMYWSEEHCA
jgi:hypothetical protein